MSRSATATKPAEDGHELPGELASIADQLELHLSALPEHFQDRVAAHVASQLVGRMLGEGAAALPPVAVASGAGHRPAPDDLLTIPEVLEARRALDAPWLRRNAAACGAIRKGGKRSALLFTLAGVDAELRRRRVPADNASVGSGADEPTLRGPKMPKGETTAHGSPRSFTVRAPRKAA